MQVKKSGERLSLEDLSEALLELSGSDELKLATSFDMIPGGMFFTRLKISAMLEKPKVEDGIKYMTGPAITIESDMIPKAGLRDLRKLQAKLIYHKAITSRLYGNNFSSHREESQAQG